MTAVRLGERVRVMPAHRDDQCGVAGVLDLGGCDARAFVRRSRRQPINRGRRVILRRRAILAYYTNLVTVSKWPVLGSWSRIGPSSTADRFSCREPRSTVRS